MVRTNPLTVILAVAAAILFLNNANAQCGNSACGGCDAGCGSSEFSYPGGACGGGCGADGAHSSFHDHLDQLKAENHRSIQRNRAWPMPFDCADRQLYFSIWEPMLTSGIETNCLFSDYHFDIRTGQLNESGRARLRTIVRKMPRGQKSVLIQDTGDPSVTNARLIHVQEVVQQWYGRDQFNQIAVTNKYPTLGLGQRYEVINQLYGDATPEPFIPVASGTGSTSDIAQ